MAEDLRISFKLEHAAFDKAVQRFVTQYKGGVSNAVRRVGFELLSRTTLRTTRVDTGRMLNGWHLSFHRRSNWVPPEDDPLQKPPDPGNPAGLRTLFVQNRVFYAVEHEFGRRGLSPLLMLTKSTIELRGELEKFLKEGMKPLWNKEINGVTGMGLSAAAMVRREEIISRAGLAREGVARKRKNKGKRL
mgnify:FL=1